MEESSFYELTSKCDVKEATIEWTKTMTKLCDKHAPWKEVTIKSDTKEVPWYNDQVYKLQEEKTKALAKHRLYGSRSTKAILKNITNKLKS